MKAGWEIRALGDLCQIVLGSTPARSFSKNWDAKKQTDNVWLSIADLPVGYDPWVSDSKEYVSELATKTMKLVPVGTLMVSFKLTLGRVAIAGRELRTNEAIASIINLDASLCSRNYLLWYFRYYDWDQAAEGGEKVKGKTLNKAKLKILPVVLPPIEEQQRIVKILDEVFTGLDEARSNVAKNIENCKELFQSVLHECLNGHEQKKCIQKLLKDCVETLKVKKKIPKKHYMPEGRFPIISQEEEEVSGYWEVEDDVTRVDTPVVIYGDHTQVVKLVGFDFVAGADGIKLLKPKNELSAAYLFYFIQANKVPSLGYARHFRHMKEILVPIPNLNEQLLLTKKLDDIKNETDQLRQEYTAQLADIDELRQSILQKAFAGELT